MFQSLLGLPHLLDVFKHVKMGENTHDTGEAMHLERARTKLSITIYKQLLNSVGHAGCDSEPGVGNERSGQSP